MVTAAKNQGIDVLQIVFKVIERCNIDCTYCYYFHGGDKSALDRPPRVSVATAAAVANWVATGCRELGIRQVIISFHGGEPMLLKPSDFTKICAEFVLQVAEIAELNFLIQTNGTILNQDWLHAFEEFDVSVGVSIDGHRIAHDRYRRDQKDRSTFDVTFSNLRRLVDWADHNPVRLPSTISVIDPSNNYGEIYSFFRELGILEMSFLLPDKNADVQLRDTSKHFGVALCQVFDAWLDEDNPDVHVRQIDDLLRPLDLSGSLSQGKYQVLVIQSDGTIAVSDSFLPALEWYKSLRSFSMSNASLIDVLNEPIFSVIENIQSTLPSKCLSCHWLRTCGGGDIENRFSTINGFDNPSVYCDSLFLFYEHAYAQLMKAGYPEEMLRKALRISTAMS